MNDRLKQRFAFQVGEPVVQVAFHEGAVFHELKKEQGLKAFAKSAFGRQKGLGNSDDLDSFTEHRTQLRCVC